MSTEPFFFVSFTLKNWLSPTLIHQRIFTVFASEVRLSRLASQTGFHHQRVDYFWLLSEQSPLNSTLFIFLSSIPHEIEVNTAKDQPKTKASIFSLFFRSSWWLYPSCTTSCSWEEWSHIFIRQQCSDHRVRYLPLARGPFKWVLYAKDNDETLWEITVLTSLSQK